MRLELVVKDFDLQKNLKYMPFLLFWGKSVRTLKVGKKFVEVELSQRGSTVFCEADAKIPEKEEKKLAERLTFCLGLKEDLGDFYRLAGKDKDLGKFLPQIRGLRLFSAPTDFEAIACIICSQMVSFEQYKKMTEAIYRSWGHFPEPAEVIKHPEKLQACGVGYRKKFLLDAARKWGREEKIVGMGRYSLEIFQLFQRRDFSSFYHDSLIGKILEKREQTEEEFLRQWGRWSGLAEVYLQKFLRDNPQV